MMNMNMHDDEIEAMSHEMDDILVSFALKYEITPMELLGITTARLIHLNSFNEEVYRFFSNVCNDKTIQQRNLQ